jgi:5-methylcytosine-specific restriction endonuclease McrA
MAIVHRDGIAGKICANPACREWKPVSEFHPARLLGIPVGDGYKSRCKECLNAGKREKRTSDPEKCREQARAYIAKNQDHVREIKRAHQESKPERYAAALQKYREAHRDEINVDARERRQTDLEHYREIGRNSYDRHREDRCAYSREYSKSNRDKLAAALNRRRARKRQAEGSHTIEEWEALKALCDYACLCCGKREPEITLTRDHVISLEKGGSDWITNIQPLCARCNSKKNTKSTDYRK